MVLNYERDYPEGMCAKNDPNTLLVNQIERTDWRKGFLIPFGAGGMAALTPILKNFSLNYPLLTGIYRVPIAFAIGAALGKFYDDFRTEQLAIRDANYRQYIRNHPDDFPPIERKKVGDLFKEWVPIR